MGKYRGEAGVVWMRGKEKGEHSHIPLEYLAPGPGRYWEDKYDVAKAKTLLDVYRSLNFMEEIGRFTIVLRLLHSVQYLRVGWTIEEIIVSAYEGNRHITSIVAVKPQRELSRVEKDRELISFSVPGPNFWPRVG